MSEKKQKQRQANGFTLIELLVVISIIMLLLGILVPGMQAFKRNADNLKQKSRFHSMEVGLELFYKDFQKYPESKALPGGTTGVVNGAHHLAEALFGRDMKGFDYKSNWYALTDSAIPDIYANDNNSGVQADIDASAARRKGPYMDLKDIGVFRLNAGIGVTWYPAAGAIAVSTETGETIYAGDDNYPSPVISDIFYKKVIQVANLQTGEEQGFRVGTPVLYFKANTDEKQSRGYAAGGFPITDYRHLIYNYEDNEAMFGLQQVHGPEALPKKNHHYRERYTEGTPSKNGDELFYDDITNEKVEQYARPINARGFLLISAGRDGIYGTNDDVTNFGK